SRDKDKVTGRDLNFRAEEIVVGRQNNGSRKGNVDSNFLARFLSLAVCDSGAARSQFVNTIDDRLPNREAGVERSYIESDCSLARIAGCRSDFMVRGRIGSARHVAR